MKKILYCNRCSEYAKHKLVGRESQMEGEESLVRLIVGIFTLGSSETLNATRYYQCEQCGHIIRKD